MTDELTEKKPKKSTRNNPSDRKWSKHVRDRIQASQIINRLQSAFEGKVELTQVQAKIGLGLLAKVLPDMSHHMTEDVTEQAGAQEQFMKLVEKIGEDSARKLYPDMAALYLDAKPATVLSIVK